MVKTCTIAGCGRKHVARGYCQTHYERFRRNGDPLGGRVSPGEPMAFMLNAVKSDSESCIVWPFSLDGGGYGKISVDGVLVGVHSEVLRLSGTEKPSPDHVAAHAPKVCHNRACINPHHLRWATPAENADDRLIDGTSNQGSRHGNAKLIESNVTSIRRDPRPASDIAASYSVSEATIRDVLSGRTWAHIK